MMPLTFAHTGEPLRVVKVGGMEDTHRHLEELGFVPNSRISIVSRISDNMILQVRDSRIALDANMARKIMVEEA